MSFIVNEGQRPPSVSAGLHKAILYGLIDLGTIIDEKWGKERRQVLMMFELPEERIEIDGKSLPRAISKTYTLSLGEKAVLRKDLESWLGRNLEPSDLKAFDLQKMFDVPVMLQVMHRKSKAGKVYANINAIMPGAKGAQTKPENPRMIFNFDDQQYSSIPDNCPAWVVDRIKQALEWAGDSQAAPHEPEQADACGDEDDRPFDQMEEPEDLKF